MSAAILIATLLVVPVAAVLLARTLVHGRPVLPVPSASASREPEPAEDRTPEIRGRILDAEGNAVPGATVRLVSFRGPYAALREAKSDPAGRYSFARVSFEPVRVVADHDPEGVVTSATLHAAEGRSTEVTLALAPNAVLGLVVDTADHPVSGATLSVEGAPWFARSATSDDAGAFRIAPVPYEATSLVAVARGYRTARVDIARREDRTELVVRVRLAAAPPVDGDVRDAEGAVEGVVVGHVYDERRGPLAGVDLRFDAVTSTVESRADTKTDEAGQYRLEGAPAGPFTLRVQRDGFRVRLLSGLRVDPLGTLTQDIVLRVFDGGAGLEFGGIGAALAQTAEGVAVSAVFAGDPAERAGLRAGDRILSVDGEEADGMSLDDVVQRLRGQAGTLVGVTIQRPKGGDTVDIVVPRAAIAR